MKKIALVTTTILIAAAIQAQTPTSTPASTPTTSATSKIHNTHSNPKVAIDPKTPVTATTKKAAPGKPVALTDLITPQLSKELIKIPLWTLKETKKEAEAQQAEFLKIQAPLKTKVMAAIKGKLVTVPTTAYFINREQTSATVGFLTQLENDNDIVIRFVGSETWKDPKIPEKLTHEQIAEIVPTGIYQLFTATDINGKTKVILIISADVVRTQNAPNETITICDKKEGYRTPIRVWDPEKVQIFTNFEEFKKLPIVDYTLIQDIEKLGLLQDGKSLENAGTHINIINARYTCNRGTKYTPFKLPQIKYHRPHIISNIYTGVCRSDELPNSQKESYINDDVRSVTMRHQKY